MDFPEVESIISPAKLKLMNNFTWHFGGKTIYDKTVKLDYRSEFLRAWNLYLTQRVWMHCILTVRPFR